MQPLLKKVSLFASLFALVSSCGYKPVGSYNCEEVVAVAVPLIPEDDDGVLRNSLATALLETGKYRYTSSEAPYELVVQLEQSFTDTIGYEWDVDKSTGPDVKRLYPNEGRRSVVALVTLRDSETKVAVLKPFRVTAMANYDFVNPIALKDIEFTDLMGQEQTVLQYSLGQLDSEEGAQAESMRPLFQDLAKNIVEALHRAPPA